MSTKYYHPQGRYVEKFNIEDVKGFVELKVLLNENIKIISGSPLKQKGEVICPHKFYPYSLYIDKGTMKYYPNKYWNGQELIGSSFQVEALNADTKEVELKIVGTYDASKEMNYVNTCYILVEDFDTIASPYAGFISTTELDGTITYEEKEYTGRMVRIDDYKNSKKVKQELENLGFIVEDAFSLDEPTLQLILYTSLFACIIIILLSANILYHFIYKKIEYRRMQYGVLKAIGYAKEEIEKNEILENCFLFGISFLLAFVFYIIIYFIVLRFFLFEFIYNNVRINVPIVYIILFLISYLFLGKQVTKKRVKKILASQTKVRNE